MNRKVYIAFKRREQVSEPYLLNYLICTLAERGFDVVMVEDDYVKTVAPIWFEKFSKGNNSLAFIEKSEVFENKGSYFIHNYDEIIPDLKDSRVVKINSNNPAHISIECKDGYVDFCGNEIYKALVS
jgi:hypothetical protein